MRDARNAGQDEIAAFFEQVMAEDSERARKCHHFIGQLTQHGTSASSPEGRRG